MSSAHPSLLKDPGENLAPSHDEMTLEIKDLRQRLFEKTCELAELKSRDDTRHAKPEQVAGWFRNGAGTGAMPINSNSEAQNLQALAPGYLIRLAQSPKQLQTPWKEALRKAPWKIGLWRALKRYQRRTKN